MKKLKRGMVSVVQLLLIVSPLLVLAQPQAPTVLTDYGSVIDKISTVINWMFGILLTLAVVFFLYAAFLYLTAAGDEEKVKKAKDVIIYVVVAVVVAVLAKGLVLVITNFFGYRGYATV